MLLSLVRFSIYKNIHTTCHYVSRASSCDQSNYGFLSGFSGTVGRNATSIDLEVYFTKYEYEK